MRRIVLAALTMGSLAAAGVAFAFDNGQFENVPPDIRA